jgi:hypothetical protein
MGSDPYLRCFLRGRGGWLSTAVTEAASRVTVSAVPDSDESADTARFGFLPELAIRDISSPRCNSFAIGLNFVSRVFKIPSNGVAM